MNYYGYQMGVHVRVLIFSVYIIFRFSIDKLDVVKEFNLNLDVHVNIEGKSTYIPLLVNVKAPIPLCNNDFSLSDLGVSSIAELADTFRHNVSNAGIDWVLEKLGIKVRPKYLP